MDDVIKKIRKTEDDARLILESAENEARALINQTKMECQTGLESSRKEFLIQAARMKEEAQITSIKDRENRIQSLFNRYIKEIGDIEKKKMSAIDYLRTILQKRLNTDV